MPLENPVHPIEEARPMTDRNRPPISPISPDAPRHEHLAAIRGWRDAVKAIRQAGAKQGRRLDRHERLAIRALLDAINEETAHVEGTSPPAH
jgi:hypothetical protein